MDSRLIQSDIRLTKTGTLDRPRKHTFPNCLGHILAKVLYKRITSKSVIDLSRGVGETGGNQRSLHKTIAIRIAVFLFQRQGSMPLDLIMRVEFLCLPTQPTPRPLCNITYDPLLMNGFPASFVSNDQRECYNVMQCPYTCQSIRYSPLKTVTKVMSLTQCV